MSRKERTNNIYCLAILLTGLVCPVSNSIAQVSGSTERLSVASDNVAADADSASPAVALNDRYVVFESEADNLSSADDNEVTDIYLRDLETNATTLFSKGDQSSLPGNGPSTNPSISLVGSDGFFIVAFESLATDLAHFPDQNGFSDIYVRASSMDFTERMSYSELFDQETDGGSFSPSVTISANPDVMVLTFSSDATNLVNNDNNGHRDIFLSTVDIKKALEEQGDEEQPGEILFTHTRISEPSSGEANGDSNNPRVSADGKFVVFESEATNLVSGLTTSGRQIFLYDIENESVSLISKGTDGLPGNATSSLPSISFAGRYIVYITTATNIVPNTQSGQYVVVRHDTQEGTSEQVNITAEAVASNGTTDTLLSATVAGNGRFVVFADNATNLVSDDNKSVIDIFAKDMETGSLVLVNGSGSDGDSASPVIAGQGFNATSGRVIYASSASNLVSSDTGGYDDIFVTPISIPALPLAPDTVIEEPPDVEIVEDPDDPDGGATVVLTGPVFDGVTESEQGSSISPLLSKGQVTRYVGTIQRSDGSNDDYKKKSGKSNRLSFSRLPPGEYEAKIKVVVGQKRAKKTIKKLKNRFRAQLKKARKKGNDRKAANVLVKIKLTAKYETVFKTPDSPSQSVIIE